MAKQQVSLQMAMAFAQYCLDNKIDHNLPESKKAWERSLAPDSAHAPAGKRGRQKGAQTRAFVYDGSGNLLGSSDCLDVDAGRMSAMASAVLAHPGKVSAILFTRGFVGTPREVEIVTADGQLVRGYPVARTTDLATGETKVSAEDSDDSDSVEAHSAE